MNSKKKNYKEIEGAEYGVDSRYTSEKEKVTDGESLMIGRFERMKNISKTQIVKAKLLQLKFRIVI